MTVNENAPNVVAYAKGFVGGKYCKGGVDPHKCADCSGFVVYVLNHFSQSGHKITRSDLPNFDGASGTKNFTKINPSSAAPGDIVVYSSHYAMLTGKGKEIVHAANERKGIIITPSYAYQSILGIYRFKYLK